MHKQRYTRIIIQNGNTTSYYSEQETSEYSRLEVQIIRQLHNAGVIGTIDVAEEGPRYSDKDITMLRRVRRLHHDLGVNLEGVEIILRLYAQLEALQQELGRYKEPAQHIYEDSKEGSNEQ